MQLLSNYSAEAALGPLSPWTDPRDNTRYFVARLTQETGTKPFEVWLAADPSAAAPLSTAIASAVSILRNRPLLQATAAVYVQQVRTFSGLGTLKLDDVTRHTVLLSVLVLSSSIDAEPARLSVSHPDLGQHALVVALSDHRARRLYLAPTDGSVPAMLLPSSARNVSFLAGLAECRADGFALSASSGDDRQTAQLKRLAERASLPLDRSGRRPQRLADLAYQLGRELGAAERVCASLALTAYLADLGYLSLPRTAVCTPLDALDERAAAEVTAHPRLGAELLDLGRVADHGCVRDGVLFHHERADGRGYPGHLRDYQIPFSAQVVALVDYYDALVNSSSGPSPPTPITAIEDIEAGIGTRFLPDVAVPFLRMIRRIALAPGAPAAPPHPAAKLAPPINDRG